MRLLTRRGVFGSNPDDARDALAPVPDGVLPLDRHPVAVYLAGIAPGSHRAQRTALRTIAALVSPDATELTLPWWALDFAHTTAIRSKLAAKFAPATANRILAALRGVLKASFKLGLMSADHMTRACSVDAVRGARVPKGRALSRGELTALFEACDAATPGGARNAALLGLLYGGGLQRVEIALDVADYDVKTGRLVVRGKGNEERVAWATNGSRDALDAWLAVRGDQPGPLFLPVTKGGQVERRRMTDQAVAELVRRLARRAKIVRFSAHDMRRTFIGDLLDGGADLATVQGLAGHASPESRGHDARGIRGALRRPRASLRLRLVYSARQRRRSLRGAARARQGKERDLHLVPAPALKKP